MIKNGRAPPVLSPMIHPKRLPLKRFAAGTPNDPAGFKKLERRLTVRPAVRAKSEILRCGGQKSAIGRHMKQQNETTETQQKAARYRAGVTLFETELHHHLGRGRSKKAVVIRSRRGTVPPILESIVKADGVTSKRSGLTHGQIDMSRPRGTCAKPWRSRSRGTHLATKYLLDNVVSSARTLGMTGCVISGPTAGSDAGAQVSIGDRIRHLHCPGH